MDAVLILGHGSMREEANKTLFSIAGLLEKRLPGKMIKPAFMQFGKPDFFDGADACINAGADRVIVLPYFLASGDHVTKDIPGMIKKISEKNPAVQFILTKPIGVHSALTEVLAERIIESLQMETVEAQSGTYFKPDEIEAESFRIIDAELGMPEKKRIAAYPVIQRVIHATGDFAFAENMRFHPKAIEAGVKAVRAGKNILVDVHMVKSGINKTFLKKWGGRVICKVSEPDIATTAKASGQTRTETAIEKGAIENIGIVAIGNAPTALAKVMELVEDGIEITYNSDSRIIGDRPLESVMPFAPDLVIGVPVGFVNAVETKGELSEKGYPFITSLGRRGGSPVAAAIINAILRLAAVGPGE